MLPEHFTSFTRICIFNFFFSAAYDPADSSCSLSEVWHGRGDPTLTTDNKPGVLLYSGERSATNYPGMPYAITTSQMQATQPCDMQLQQLIY